MYRDPPQSSLLSAGDCLNPASCISRMQTRQALQMSYTPNPLYGIFPVTMYEPIISPATAQCKTRKGSHGVQTHLVSVRYDHQISYAEEENKTNENLNIRITLFRFHDGIGLGLRPGPGSESLLSICKVLVLIPKQQKCNYSLSKEGSKYFWASLSTKPKSPTDILTMLWKRKRNSRG